MLSIHAQLKLLRQARGLTQEEVAGRIGVTRQAVSSYESGRTRPDLETLERLAALYQVTLEDLLYGTDRLARQRRRLRITAGIAAVLLWAGSLLRSLLMLAANLWLRLDTGVMLTDGAQTAIEARFGLAEARDAAAGLAFGGFWICCLVLLILSLQLERPVPLGRRAACWGVLALGALLATVPWGLMDPLFHLIDYALPAVLCLGWAAFFLLLELAVRGVRRLRAR